MSKNQDKYTRFSMHAINNILGNQEQLSLFENQDEIFAEEFQITLQNKISKFGIDLEDIEMKVMEGILKGFSETGYKGNAQSKNAVDYYKEKFNGNTPEACKEILELPVLRANQTEILNWANIKTNSIGAKSRAIEAISNLGSTQFCFYYERLVKDSDGVGMQDAKGNWIKEYVTTVDTLFSIKKVTQKGSSSLLYYEIIPSSIFLDQIQGYFMLVPYSWREEVKKIFGNKKTSKYTFRFLLYLRYHYETVRRKKKNLDKPIKISLTSESIAIKLKIPESIYKNKPKRLNELLESAYSVAKELGYLKSYERSSTLDILVLNNHKYTINQQPSLKASIDANELLKLFIKNRKLLDPKFNALEEKLEREYLKVFDSILETRTKDEVSKVINWSTKNTHWSSRLHSPHKIQANFSEVWIEMNAKTPNEEKNIEFLRKQKGDLSKKKIVFDFKELLNKNNGNKALEVYLKDLNSGLEYSEILNLNLSQSKIEFPKHIIVFINKVCSHFNRQKTSQSTYK